MGVNNETLSVKGLGKDGDTTVNALDPSSSGVASETLISNEKTNNATVINSDTSTISGDTTNVTEDNSLTDISNTIDAVDTGSVDNESMIDKITPSVNVNKGSIGVQANMPNTVSGCGLPTFNMDLSLPTIDLVFDGFTLDGLLGGFNLDCLNDFVGSIEASGASISAIENNLTNIANTVKNADAKSVLSSVLKNNLNITVENVPEIDKLVSQVDSSITLTKDLYNAISDLGDTIIKPVNGVNVIKAKTDGINKTMAENSDTQDTINTDVKTAIDTTITAVSILAAVSEIGINNDSPTDPIVTVDDSLVPIKFKDSDIVTSTIEVDKTEEITKVIKNGYDPTKWITMDFAENFMDFNNKKYYKDDLYVGPNILTINTDDTTGESTVTEKIITPNNYYNKDGVLTASPKPIPSGNKKVTIKKDKADQKSVSDAIVTSVGYDPEYWVTVTYYDDIIAKYKGDDYYDVTNEYIGPNFLMILDPVKMTVKEFVINENKYKAPDNPVGDITPVCKEYKDMEPESPYNELLTTENEELIKLGYDPEHWVTSKYYNTRKEYLEKQYTDKDGVYTGPNVVNISNEIKEEIINKDNVVPRDTSVTKITASNKASIKQNIIDNNNKLNPYKDLLVTESSFIKRLGYDPEYWVTDRYYKEASEYLKTTYLDDDNVYNGPNVVGIVDTKKENGLLKETIISNGKVVPRDKNAESLTKGEREELIDKLIEYDKKSYNPFKEVLNEENIFLKRLGYDPKRWITEKYYNLRKFFLDRVYYEVLREDSPNIVSIDCYGNINETIKNTDNVSERNTSILDLSQEELDIVNSNINNSSISNPYKDLLLTENRFLTKLGYDIEHWVTDKYYKVASGYLNKTYTDSNNIYNGPNIVSITDDGVIKEKIIGTGKVAYKAIESDVLTKEESIKLRDKMIADDLENNFYKDEHLEENIFLRRLGYNPNNWITEKYYSIKKEFLDLVYYKTVYEDTPNIVGLNSKGDIVETIRNPDNVVLRNIDLVTLTKVEKELIDKVTDTTDVDDPYNEFLIIENKFLKVLGYDPKYWITEKYYVAVKDYLNDKYVGEYGFYKGPNIVNYTDNGKLKETIRNIQGIVERVEDTPELVKDNKTIKEFKVIKSDIEINDITIDYKELLKPYNIILEPENIYLNRLGYSPVGWITKRYSDLVQPYLDIIYKDDNDNYTGPNKVYMGDANKLVEVLCDTSPYIHRNWSVPPLTNGEKAIIKNNKENPPKVEDPYKDIIKTDNDLLTGLGYNTDKWITKRYYDLRKPYILDKYTNDDGVYNGPNVVDFKDDNTINEIIINSKDKVDKTIRDVALSDDDVKHINNKQGLIDSDPDYTKMIEHDKNILSGLGYDPEHWITNAYHESRKAYFDSMKDGKGNYIGPNIVTVKESGELEERHPLSNGPYVSRTVVNPYVTPSNKKIYLNERKRVNKAGFDVDEFITKAYYDGIIKPNIKDFTDDISGEYFGPTVLIEGLDGKLKDPNNYDPTMYNKEAEELIIELSPVSDNLMSDGVRYVTEKYFDNETMKDSKYKTDIIYDGPNIYRLNKDGEYDPFNIGVQVPEVNLYLSTGKIINKDVANELSHDACVDNGYDVNKDPDYQRWYTAYYYTEFEAPEVKPYDPGTLYLEKLKNIVYEPRIGDEARVIYLNTYTLMDNYSGIDTDIKKVALAENSKVVKQNCSPLNYITIEYYRKLIDKKHPDFIGNDTTSDHFFEDGKYIGPNILLFTETGEVVKTAFSPNTYIDKLDALERKHLNTSPVAYLRDKEEKEYMESKGYDGNYWVSYEFYKEVIMYNLEYYYKDDKYIGPNVVIFLLNGETEKQVRVYLNANSSNTNDEAINEFNKSLKYGLNPFLAVTEKSYNMSFLMDIDEKNRIIPKDMLYTGIKYNGPATFILDVNSDNKTIVTKTPYFAVDYLDDAILRDTSTSLTGFTIDDLPTYNVEDFIKDELAMLDKVNNIVTEECITEDMYIKFLKDDDKYWMDGLYLGPTVIRISSTTNTDSGKIEYLGVILTSLELK